MYVSTKQSSEAQMHKGTKKSGVEISENCVKRRKKE